MAKRRTNKTPDTRESDSERLGREAFIYLYLASGRLTAQVEELCREEQMTMSHYTVLWFLARRDEPDGVPMGAVIDGQLNRASDATRLADRLTKLGLIERNASPSDRRVVLVLLTDEGRAVYARLTRRILDLHARQWSALTAEELRELSRLLAKVLRGVDDSWRKLEVFAAGGAGT
jgi:DNA-binding MarR family transcriptional regulator